MTSTSRMSGTLVMVVRPGASSAAAISFSTLFFAPPTGTLPWSGWLCWPRDTTRNACIEATLRRLGCIHGQPHPHLHEDR